MNTPFTIEVKDGIAVASWDKGRIAAVPRHNHSEWIQPNPIDNIYSIVAELTDGTIIRGVSSMSHADIPEILKLQIGTPASNHYHYLKSLAAANSDVIDAVFDKPENKDYPHICPKCGMPAYIGLSAVECSKNCC